MSFIVIIFTKVFKILKKGYLFFLNEFMHGGSIAFHLEKMNKFPESLIIFYAAQIVSVMVYLHQNHSIIL